MRDADLAYNNQIEWCAELVCDFDCNCYAASRQGKHNDVLFSISLQGVGQLPAGIRSVFKHGMHSN